MRNHLGVTSRLATASSVALFVLAVCASCSGAGAGGGDGGGGGTEGTGGSGGSGGAGGGGGGGGSGGIPLIDSGGLEDAGGTDSGGRHHHGHDGGVADDGAFDEASGGGDATWSGDVIDSADVTWGEPCLYNFGSSCPFKIPQECGNHQAISVTFPKGPQLLNATLFAGVDCSTTALNDNFNDSQMKLGSDLWMFTDDADVAGVSASNPTSAIWWVGALTPDGFPPAGAPTTGCINYTSSMKMCE